MDPVLGTVLAAGLTALGAVAVALITSTSNRSGDRLSFEVERLGFKAEIQRLRSIIKRLGGDPDEEA